MESLAEAAAAVRVARRRLLLAATADGVARGALVGAAVGAIAWIVGRSFHADLAAWPLIVPALGAAVGGLVALRRGVEIGVAATTLDAAAGTDEAFVASLAAADAAPEMRSLVAAYALARCPRTSVRRFLPLSAPAAASAAAVATALVAALVLVPRAAATERDSARAPDRESNVVSGAASPSAETSPRERVERFLKAATSSDARTDAPKAAAVRKDLGALTDGDLRELAAALAPSSEAAKRALAALDRGDRATATAALREALGGAATASSPNGSGTGAATTATPSAPPAWSGATWPLRYDAVVRRWMEQQAAVK